MSTQWEPGDIKMTFGPSGLDCNIFDVVDDEGKLEVLCYFPRDEWENCDDEDAQLELINLYTFPDYCIQSATWEEAPGDADAGPDEICIFAQIEFDLS